MAVTATQSNGSDRVQMAVGAYLDDAASPADARIVIGFKARYVEVVDSTGNEKLEWYEGMASGGAVKTGAAGDRSTVTSGGISVQDREFSFPVTQNEQYYWRAIG